MLVEVWQDTVCPWCRIGERHLKLALEQWRGEPVEVRYRAFFLDPHMPVEGRDFIATMTRKGGGQVPLESFFAEPRRRGEAIGLKFNFEQIGRMPNTMLSHRLVALAPEDKKGAVLEAVYAAFFEHGQDIGQLDVLLDIAAAQGLDRAATAEQLASEPGKAEVLDDVREAQQLGVTGVPFFVFGRRYALSGAQPPEMILRALERTAVDLSPGK
jgi:predicted DsbA family dithiol-disulfide isomerase